MSALNHNDSDEEYGMPDIERTYDDLKAEVEELRTTLGYGGWKAQAEVYRAEVKRLRAARDGLYAEVERLRNGGAELDGVIRRLSDENERLRDVIARASRLCEGRDTAMVLQVLRESSEA